MHRAGWRARLHGNKWGGAPASSAPPALPAARWRCCRQQICMSRSRAGKPMCGEHRHHCAACRRRLAFTTPLLCVLALASANVLTIWLLHGRLQHAAGAAEAPILGARPGRPAPAAGGRVHRADEPQGEGAAPLSLANGLAGIAVPPSALHRPAAVPQLTHVALLPNPLHAAPHQRRHRGPRLLLLRMRGSAHCAAALRPPGTQQPQRQVGRARGGGLGAMSACHSTQLFTCEEAS